MPRFPYIDQVTLPLTFERYVPGKLHSDGRRYLPLLVFALSNGAHVGVVDRHHLVEPELVGQSGVAQLILLLSDVGLQPEGSQRSGILPEPTVPGRVPTKLDAFGRVIDVPTWEVRKGMLPYDVIYTELLLDTGLGVVGVRTTITADDLQAKLGKERIDPGNWIHVIRSRIDILGFNVTESVPNGS
jgi:hypothetical protein